MHSGDLARLEAHVLGILDRGEVIRTADLRRDFPDVEEADLLRMQLSAEILQAWLDELGAPEGSHGRDQGRSLLEPGDRIGGYIVLRRVPGGPPVPG
jgi:hypothetical protein